MKVLSIDGGGILGLATASFLAESERHFNTSFHEKFDLFCGTSTGAIIALALATGLSASEVVELYKKLGPEVFSNPKLSKHYISAKFSNDRLIASLDSAFSDTQVKDVLEKGKYICVPAFCLTKGAPRIFKTDHSSDLTTDNDYHLRDIALASAAAPTYLPIVQIKSPTHGIIEEFCDGGIYANHPALIGYTEAISHLRVSPSEVSLLSISTPRKKMSRRPIPQDEKDRLSRGVVQWGSYLFECGIDGTSEIVHQSMKRIFHAGQAGDYVRVLLENENEIPFDTADQADYDELCRIGHTAATSNDLRPKIQPFLR